MGVEEDILQLTKLAESSDATDDGQALASAVDSDSLLPSPLVVPSVAAPPVKPSVALFPTPSVLPPFAPLPVRPPVLRPPASKNEDVVGSELESDSHEMGFIGTSHGSTAEYEISEESRQVRERQEKAMQDLMMKRRAAALAVPTNDKAVRARLRRLGEPMTLFGEREMERRDRLRMIMARLDAEGQLEKLMKAHEEEEAASFAAADDVEEEMLQYPFYTEGSKALFRARIDIAKFSIARAASRLQRSRRRRDDPDEDLHAEINWALKQAENSVLECSEIGDDRPLSGCSFSNDGKLLATW